MYKLVHVYLFTLNYIFCHMFVVCEIMYERLVHVFFFFFFFF